MTSSLRAATGAAVLGVFLCLAPVIVRAQSIDVIASGLANPRGLNFGPDGALYVVEAGRGGNGACQSGPEGTRCFGESSAIARIDKKTGVLTRIITGLPSLAGADGSSSIGAHDISFNGRGNGAFTIGYGGEPNGRTTFFGAAGSRFARLNRVLPSGSWSSAEDLGSFEETNDPLGDGPDSNPYGLLALPGKVIVTDAGGNSLVEVSANGKIRTLAVFPNRDTTATAPLPPVPVNIDAVPTCVALGPDGYYYVGQLTGGPFPTGQANVYRVPPDGGTPQVALSGFSAIIDIAFAPDGSLYVLQISKNLLASFMTGDVEGALIKVSPDGARTEIAAGHLIAPGGIAVGTDGALYVTNRSIDPSAGEVLRIIP